MLSSGSIPDQNQEILAVLERDERLFSAMLAHDLEARVVSEVFRNRASLLFHTQGDCSARCGNDSPHENGPSDYAPEPHLGWLAEAVTTQGAHVPDPFPTLAESGILEGLLEHEHDEGMREAAEETLCKAKKLFLALKAKDRLDEFPDDVSTPLDFACSLDDLSIE